MHILTSGRHLMFLLIIEDQCKVKAEGSLSWFWYEWSMIDDYYVLSHRNMPCFCYPESISESSELWKILFSSFQLSCEMSKFALFVLPQVGRWITFKRPASVEENVIWCGLLARLCMLYFVLMAPSKMLIKVKNNNLLFIMRWSLYGMTVI